MPVRQHTATKVTQIVTDSMDNRLLPEDTKPIHFAVDNTEYTLYLSEANKAKFAAMVERMTRHEKPSVSQNSDEKPSIREWAKNNGMEIAPRGRIKKSIVQQYEAQFSK